MPLSADTLLDRIHLKNLLTKWRVIAIVAVTALLVVATEKHGNLGPLKKNYIARVSIDGVIMDDMQRDKMLDELRDDKKAKAVIVRLDTPGGSAVGGQMLYKKLRAIAEKKPVVAVMRSMATSAGYLTAIGADYVLAMEGTITGSIGVILQMAEVTELAEKLGINPITIKSGPNKGSPSPFEKFTPKQAEIIQAAIMDFYAYFVDLVAERRHLPRETVATIADGRIYSGKQALDLKLVDQLGGEEEALAWLADNRKIDTSLEINDIKEENAVPSLLDSVKSLANGKIFSNLHVTLDGLLLIWQPNAL